MTSKPPNRRKAWIVNAIKLLIAAGLISWMIRSGQIDLAGLKLFVSEPQIFLINAFIWSVMMLGLGGLRWYFLVRALGLRLTIPKALRLQAIGFFFNTAMPGAVGGDLVKAVYIVREQDRGLKAGAILSVAADRIIGLFTLLIIGGIAIAANVPGTLGNPSLRPVALFALALLGGALAGIAVFAAFGGRKYDPIARLLGHKFPLSGALRGVYEAFLSYRKSPLTILIAIGLTALIQGSLLLFFGYVTMVFNGEFPPLAQLATLYPIGVLMSAIPLAPGGLGVGHMAFERLYTMAGIANGANVFNLIILAQLAMHLLGAIPYLMHRTELPDASEIESELGQADSESSIEESKARGGNTSSDSAHQPV